MYMEHLWSGEGAVKDGSGGSMMVRKVVIAQVNTFTRPERKSREYVEYMRAKIWRSFRHM